MAIDRMAERVACRIVQRLEAVVNGMRASLQRQRCRGQRDLRRHAVAVVLDSLHEDVAQGGIGVHEARLRCRVEGTLIVVDGPQFRRHAVTVALDSLHEDIAQGGIGMGEPPAFPRSSDCSRRPAAAGAFGNPCGNRFGAACCTEFCREFCMARSRSKPD